RVCPIPWVIRDERNGACPDVNLSFGNKFHPRPIPPMAEQNRRERPCSVWNNQVSIDRTAFRACVGYVMEGTAIKLLDHFVVNSKRLLRVIVEPADCGLKVRPSIRL